MKQTKKRHHQDDYIDASTWAYWKVFLILTVPIGTMLVIVEWLKGTI